MAVFKIKQDSTDPVLAVQLIDDSTGSGINLTNGSHTFFKLSTNDNKYTPVFSGLAVWTGSETGLVEYRWTIGNTSGAGLFLGEFTTTFNDSSILTLPSDDSLVIKINTDYDN